ncbi:hypothetical protein [Streptomyces mangrovisoli]|uniref:Uncharacterized protein n=1 Tax=Streptomyces mangrovisoli TaxID=1428628 RepID=A0A1J4NT76_9ACTN|nr:hypothetical protein [Streptomyces mangrovisoli]OIJ64318.1 hypothetical protein WN71_029650 [Streptomyces mangrovisoli]
MTSPHRPAGPRTRLLVTAVVTGTLAAGVLAGCSDNSDSGSSASKTPSAPETGSFTGSTPSAVKSSASAALSSARASASSAASSLSARASEFEASVDAETGRRAETAQNELKGVSGGGNAKSDVSMKGLNNSTTGGVLAVLVTITNTTDKKASYAVQIDFENDQGKVVETRYTGAENLEPGKKAQPIVFSRQPSEPRLTAHLAKAQRY